MRILIISPFPPPVHGHSLAGKMAYEGLKQTNEVTIIDSALDKNFSGNKLPPIYSPNRIWKILVTLVRDSRIFFSQHYDIVYMGIGISFRGFMRYAPYMVMAMMKNEPYVLHTHGSTFRAMYDSVGEWKRFVLRFLLKRAAGVIVLGNSLRSMFEGIVSEGEIYVCENGVENTSFAKNADIEGKKRQRGRKLSLLFLSNLMRAKGILELIEAFPSVPDAVLHLAGAVEPDDEVKGKISRFCKENPDRVIYHGVVHGEEKRKLLLNSDIFVLPSKNEGQPISILEAYATGCAVVTDEKVGGISDIYTDGINGVGCNHDSAESIASAIESTRKTLDIYTDVNYKAAHRYSQQAFTERLEAILKQAVAGKPGR